MSTFGRVNGFPAHDYRDILELPPLTERPVLFSGKRYLELLRKHYGEDLRGLSFAELERLPDADWTQEEPKQSWRHKLQQKLGRTTLLHPSQPGFSFSKCPDFFDGKSYLIALVSKYGLDLEELPPEDIGNLPILEVPSKYYTDPADAYLKHTSPVERTDYLRAAHAFLAMPRVEFSE